MQKVLVPLLVAMLVVSGFVFADESAKDAASEDVKVVRYQRSLRVLSPFSVIKDLDDAQKERIIEIQNDYNLKIKMLEDERDAKCMDVLNESQLGVMAELEEEKAAKKRAYAKKYRERKKARELAKDEELKKLRAELEALKGDKSDSEDAGE